MLYRRWADVVQMLWPALKQHWFNVFCLSEALPAGLLKFKCPMSTLFCKHMKLIHQWQGGLIKPI